MEAVVYSNFRNKMKAYFRQVNENMEPLIVVNKNPDENVVVVSKAEWDSLQETLYVMSNPYLSDKIMKGMEQVRLGKTANHDLIEVEDE
ncbi:antitoxin YefM [Pilibacter termitis]|jgi:antitoxin YefM|uniref:Antitoxin n=1 Tax=Pilibacter termitis TaxID=263852 RepID=A0A1T4LR53_9ENTE|nr:type II toxin-antitoxin system prevent-host-death family antitoxin [Pilibacter termitis]SJZ57210.1 antitoxin YefM [Pilibacter termitis]